MVAARERHCPLTTRQRFFKRDLHLDVQIGSALRRRQARPALGEHFGEQIAEGRRVVNSTRREIESLESAPVLRFVRARRVPGVVARPARRIDQRLVRLEDLTEPRRRRLVTRVDVRVKPARKTTVSPLDLGLRRSLLNAEHYVQIH
jgi:hypothetical protein